MKNIFISVVIPCYSCNNTLKELEQQLCETLSGQGFNYEIIFVNDHSPQDDWQIITELAQNNPKVIGINFSKNFGQHFAITAGLDHSKGDFVVVMDGDLEDKPEDIIKLYNKQKEGFDLVYGKKTSRGKKNFIDNFLSNAYYKIYDFLANSEQSTNNASFVLMSRKVVESYKSLGEKKRQFAPLLNFLGFRKGTVILEENLDQDQPTTYTFSKRFDMALTGIIANSTKLLKICTLLGLCISSFAFIYAITIVALKIFGIPVKIGWSSLIISIFLMGGIILSFLGVVALYIETIITEVKSRPLYIVSDTINLN